MLQPVRMPFASQRGHSSTPVFQKSESLKTPLSPRTGSTIANGNENPAVYVGTSHLAGRRAMPVPLHAAGKGLAETQQTIAEYKSLMTEHEDTLRNFIADENEAFAERRQGKYWPRNHHRISPLVGKVSGLLGPAERTEFYFHLMRVDGSIPAVSDGELPLLLEAYRRLLPFLDLGGVIQMARRHTFLYVFGFDDSGALPGGETCSAKALREHLKLVAQVDSYTSLPAQRDKKARFAAHADRAERVLATLRHLGYRHDRRYDRDDLYSLTDLNFWGMVFIALLNDQTRGELLDDMVGGRYDLVCRDEQLTQLHRYVEVVLPDAGPDEEKFRSLAGQLAAVQLQRRRATESVALAEKLGLPFGADEDWEIAMSIPLVAEAEQDDDEDCSVDLYIWPDPDGQWDIKAQLGDLGRYSESDSEVIRNDGDIPALGAGNLEAFPTWLAQLQERHGLRADLDDARIYVGRKRAAVKLLKRWLAGG